MKLQLDTGEQGEAMHIEGNVLTLLSPRAFAAGSPIRFAVVADDGERALEGRTIGSKRVDDEQFEVRMRFVNLRRADRELLNRELS